MSPFGTRFQKVWFGSLCLIVLTFPVFSQEPAPEAGKPAAESKTDPKAADRWKELRAKTDQLLQEILTDTKNLRSAENRERVLIETGELLWGSDKELAQAIFTEVVNSFDTVLKERARFEEDETEPDLTVNLYVELVQRISQKDVNLAYSLLKATRQLYFPAPEPADAQRLNEFEFSLFKQVAANDPKALLKFAQESLGKGLSDGLLGVVDELNAKDPKLAAVLVTDMIARLKTDSANSRRETMRFSLQLLGKIFPGMYSEPGVQTDATTAKGLPVEAGARRELLNLIQHVIGKMEIGSPFDGDSFAMFRTLRNILPEIERASPALGQVLRAKNAEYERLYGGLEKARTEMVSMMQKGTTQSFLDQANRTGNEQYIGLAVNKAMSEGNLDQARQIVQQKVTDPTMRKEYLDTIDRQKVSVAIETGEINAARQSVYAIKSRNERVRMLVSLAGSAVGKEDFKTAGELLREAQLLLPPRPETQIHFQIFLEIAKAYQKVDSNVGFELVEVMVDQVNELAAAMATLDGFGYTYSRKMRNNEFSADRNHQAVSLLYDWADSVASLAEVDFDRAKAVCDRVSRTELRALARLKLAEAMVTALAAHEPEPAEPTGGPAK